MYWTPLWVASKAIRKCWSSEDKSDTVNTDDNIGAADRALIDRVGNQNKHSSTLEHLVYNFDIDGISRACLQELARHRISSLSVKSSRYTLKELKNEEPFVTHRQIKEHSIGKSMPADYEHSYDFVRASNYVVLTENQDVNEVILMSLDRLRGQVKLGISNDIAKYCLPEAYKTSLVWSINARSLQNFLGLRINPRHALWEIVQLAEKISLALPNEHKYLYKDIIEQTASPCFKEVFNESMI